SSRVVQEKLVPGGVGLRGGEVDALVAGEAHVLLGEQERQERGGEQRPAHPAVERLFAHDPPPAAGPCTSRSTQVSRLSGTAEPSQSLSGPASARGRTSRIQPSYRGAMDTWASDSPRAPSTPARTGCRR